MKAQLVAFLTKKVRPTPPVPLSPLALAHRGPSLSSFSRAAPSPRVSRPSTAPLVSSRREPTTRSCKQSARLSPPCLLHRPLLTSGLPSPRTEEHDAKNPPAHLKASSTAETHRPRSDEPVKVQNDELRKFIERTKRELEKEQQEGRHAGRR